MLAITITSGIGLILYVALWVFYFVFITAEFDSVKVWQGNVRFKELTRPNLVRMGVGLIFLLVVAFPWFYLFHYDAYYILTDQGVRYNPPFSIGKELKYSWSDIRLISKQYPNNLKYYLQVDDKLFGVKEKGVDFAKNRLNQWQ